MRPILRAASDRAGVRTAAPRVDGQTGHGRRRASGMIHRRSALSSPRSSPHARPHRPDVSLARGVLRLRPSPPQLARARRRPVLALAPGPDVPRRLGARHRRAVPVPARARRAAAAAASTCSRAPWTSPSWSGGSPAGADVCGREGSLEWLLARMQDVPPGTPSPPAAASAAARPVPAASAGAMPPRSAGRLPPPLRRAGGARRPAGSARAARAPRRSSGSARACRSPSGSTRGRRARRACRRA